MKKIGRKLAKNAQAVSPVIATLMLVLVSVGSAGAFYAWQSGWQGGIENEIGTGNDWKNADIVIGGSSTVYEFSALAAPMFEDEYENRYRVSIQKGGSGAGITAVGTGVVDIGSASKDLSASDYEKYPDLEVFKVAVDAVVMIVPSANTHGLQSIDRTTLQDMYKIKTDAPANSLLQYANIPAGGPIAWTTVPSTVTPTHDDVLLTIPANTFPSATMTGSGFCYVIGSVTNAYCNYTAAAGTVTLTLVNGALPAASENVDVWDCCITAGNVETYERSEESGTEGVFVNKVLGEAKDYQLSSYGYEADYAVESNQALIEELKLNSDGIAFMSFGIADSSGDVEVIDLSIDNTNVITPSKNTILGKTGYDQYPGARPINYITNGEPSGLVKIYLDYVMQPEVNLNLCDTETGCGYLSIYA